MIKERATEERERKREGMAAQESAVARQREEAATGRINSWGKKGEDAQRQMSELHERSTGVKAHTEGGEGGGGGRAQVVDKARAVLRVATDGRNGRPGEGL